MKPVLQAPIESLPPAGAPWRERPILLDASKYQTKLDWKAAKADGVVGAIIRGGQGDYEVDAMLREHVQAAHDAGLPAGIYWVVDPWVYGSSYGLKPELWPRGASDKTAAAMQKALLYKTYHFLALDLELFKTDTGQDMTEAWVATVYRHVYDQVCETFPGVPVLVYTARWVVERFPSLTLFLDHVRELWLAQYPVHPAQVVHLGSLSEWRQKYAPPDDWRPALFGSIQGALLWQVSGDRFTLPYHRGAGGLSAADINLWSGSVDSFYAFARWSSEAGGETPAPPPTAPTQFDRIESSQAAMLQLLRELRGHFS